VILALGHFVVGWALPDLLKFSIILSGSFAIVLGVYEFGVRRNNLLRVLFGMKPKPRHALDVQPNLAPQAM
jgi:hypothetical protein